MDHMLIGYPYYLYIYIVKQNYILQIHDLTKIHRPRISVYIVYMNNNTDVEYGVMY